MQMADDREIELRGIERTALHREKHGRTAIHEERRAGRLEEIRRVEMRRAAEGIRRAEDGDLHCGTIGSPGRGHDASLSLSPAARQRTRQVACTPMSTGRHRVTAMTVIVVFEPPSAPHPAFRRQLRAFLVAFALLTGGETPLRSTGG